MNPERLWEANAWSPGICWRCSTVAWVAVCGSSHCASGATEAVIEVCALCMVEVETIHAARVRWQHQGITPATPEQLAAYYTPAARLPEQTEHLRRWIDDLMAPLDAETVAALVYGVRGRVALPEEEAIDANESGHRPAANPADPAAVASATGAQTSVSGPPTGTEAQPDTGPAKGPAPDELRGKVAFLRDRLPAQRHRDFRRK